MHAVISMSHVTLAQDVCPHHVIHASCAVVVLILFDSPLCTLHRLTHLLFHSPDLHLHLPCGLVRGEAHCALPRMRSWALWPTTILSHLEKNWKYPNGQKRFLTALSRWVPGGNLLIHQPGNFPGSPIQAEKFRPDGPR